ncbi:2-keto-4-pentenoate hydratase [Heyndrickxia acidiproducens]|uniref:2-keto-4-pentenoate hydratase n=1 Tax=Heyndrickxia acidiproducens TaxID=1121084 RepID=UPI000382DC94|nr:fumarylacetoacetate hydrolase [Heyndrickxia acidiproducens]
MLNEAFLSTLYESYKNVKALNKDIFPAGMDLDKAYQVQHAFTAAKKENHETLKGYKISMTSPETQALFDAKEPLYGELTDKQVTNHVSLSKDMLNPLVELELVFLVKERLTANASEAEIIQKTQVAPGLEIPDSRFKDWFPKMPKEQVCADGAVGGKVTFGDAKDYTYDDIDDINGQLFFNGQVLDEGKSSVVMGHPLHAVKWLLKKLGEQKRALEPGMFVSSGTFVLPKPPEAGTYSGKFEGIGTVKLTVTD